MDKKDELKRLALIKKLFLIGVRQSEQNEIVACFSILSFHDSIEMFLRLLAEKKDVNSSKLDFMKYWDKIEGIGLKESMRSLNDLRKNLKHKGIIPAKSEVNSSKTNACEFFRQNCKKFFSTNFESLSLVELIENVDIRKQLRIAQENLFSSKYEDCIKECAYAFDDLLYSFEENKYRWGSSPFNFGRSLDYFGNNFFNQAQPFETGKLNEFADAVSESISCLQKAMRIISLGIDYKEYSKFITLTPEVKRSSFGRRLDDVYGKKIWSEQNCQFCIDFVIDTALVFEESDYDLSSLEEHSLGRRKLRGNSFNSTVEN